MSGPTTLGLDNDLDPLLLQVAVEDVFGVKFEAEEAAGTITMGDVHDLLVRKLAGAGGTKCQTSMSFFRVCRALKAVLGDVDIRPDTPLRSLWRESPKRLWARLQNNCELHLPALTQTVMTGVGALLWAAALFGVPILMIAQVHIGLILAFTVVLVAVGFALVRMDPKAFGPELATVGDLARRTATRNFGTLANLGGRVDGEAIWNALVEVATGSAENPPQKVDRATYLLQVHFDAARKRA